MATGTVKLFNPSKGYGFIRMDSSGEDVFVHLSGVQQAGLAELRKGQKLSFEIFDNNGEVAAKNLSVNGPIKNVSEVKLVSLQNEVAQNARFKMSSEAAQLSGHRTSITRAALELVITEAVRESDLECKSLIGVIVERVARISPGGANWAIKGVKYGEAERDRCSAVISNCVAELQREFEVSD
jgi:cold shock CspA family protein